MCLAVHSLITSCCSSAIHPFVPKAGSCLFRRYCWARGIWLLSRCSRRRQQSRLNELPIIVTWRRDTPSLRFGPRGLVGSRLLISDCALDSCNTYTSAVAASSLASTIASHMDSAKPSALVQRSLRAPSPLVGPSAPVRYRLPTDVINLNRFALGSTSTAHS